MASKQVHRDLAVIWVDAQADANTPETSPSMHYHGMPAAHLMGWFKKNPLGFEWFPKTYCSEAQFSFIGLRDVDKKEGELLMHSDIHVFSMREVDELGLKACIERAIQGVDPSGRRPIHLSLDVDAVDPSVAPGTGTRARGGLSYREIHYICEEIALTGRLVSMDLVEVNPGLDPPLCDKLHGDDKDLNRTTPTVGLGIDLILSALGKSIMKKNSIVDRIKARSRNNSINEFRLNPGNPEEGKEGGKFVATGMTSPMKSNGHDITGRVAGFFLPGSQEKL